jgi:protein phosphatase
MVLCSDGLYGEVGEERMTELLRSAVEGDTKMNDLCADFVDEAILAGGRDNITVICIKV